MFSQNDIQSTPFLQITEEERLRLLNSQISYARANSRAYATRLKNVPALYSFSELSSVPMLKEEDIRKEGTGLVCVSGAAVRRIVSARTSGTDGPVKRIFFTENDLERTKAFFEAGMGWMCRSGDRVAILLPNASPDGLSDLLAKALTRIGSKPVQYPVYQKDAEVAAGIIQQQPDVIVGYPWYVRFLSILYPQLRPKVVLLSADYVPTALKECINRAWGAKVLTHYGLTETGYGCAVEHPEGNGMYLRKQDLFAEIIDPKDEQVLQPGEKGELVLTTLRREAMPLIRYRTGDLAEMNLEGSITRIYGRLGERKEFYWEQEQFSELPWLYDYYKTKEGIIAEVTPEAPASAREIIQEICGCEEIVIQVETDQTARPLLMGKRIES